MFGTCFVKQHFVSKVCNHLDGKERADSFSLSFCCVVTVSGFD